MKINLQFEENFNPDASVLLDEENRVTTFKDYVNGDVQKAWALGLTSNSYFQMTFFMLSMSGETAFLEDLQTTLNKCVENYGPEMQKILTASMEKRIEEDPEGSTNIFDLAEEVIETYTEQVELTQDELCEIVFFLGFALSKQISDEEEENEA